MDYDFDAALLFSLLLKHDHGLCYTSKTVIVFDFSMFTSIAIPASLGHSLTVRSCAVPHSGAALFICGSFVRFFRAGRGKTAHR